MYNNLSIFNKSVSYSSLSQNLTAARVVRISFTNSSDIVNLSFNGVVSQVNATSVQYFLMPSTSFNMSVTASGYATLSKSIDPSNVTDFESVVTFDMIKFTAQTL